MGLSTITNAVHNITRLPSLASSSAPQLGAHVEEAKSFAQTWLASHGSNLAKSVSSASALATHWASVSSPQLNGLATNAAANKDKIKAILQQACTDAEPVQTLLKGSSAEAKNDDDKLMAITGNLTGDAQMISTALKGDQSAINDLHKRIGEAHAKISEYKSRQKWYWIGGPLVYLLAHEIDSLASNVSGYEHQLTAYTQSANQDQQEINALHVTMSGVNNWLSAMNAAGTALGGIDSGLDSLLANLSETVASMDGVDTSTLPVWLHAQIATISADYSNVGGLATQLNN